MQNRIPRISIVVAAYNQNRFIAQSIQSILDQKRPDMEIVIGDDHSKDGTYEIIETYAKRYPNLVTAWRNDLNLGITGNCNAILRRCRGEIIVFHAGDDIMLPGKIATQAGAMMEDPECLLCFHNAEAFESDSDKRIRLWNAVNVDPDSLSGDAREIARLLVERGTSFMAATTVAVRRRVIPPEGFNPRLPFASDWLFWVDVCARHQGKVKYINKVLSRYRQHGRSATVCLSKECTLDSYVTLALIEARYPWLRREVRRARGRLYYIEASQALRRHDIRSFAFLAKEGMHQRVLPVFYSGDTKKVLRVFSRLSRALAKSFRRDE